MFTVFVESVSPLCIFLYNALLPLLAATGSASVAQLRRFFLEFFDFPIVFYQCENFFTVFVEPLRSLLFND